MASLAQPAAVVQVASESEAPPAAPNPATRGGELSLKRGQAWRSQYNSLLGLKDANGNPYILLVPGEPTSWYCVGCVLEPVWWDAVVAGQYSKLPCCPAAARALIANGCAGVHKNNLVRHLEGPQHEARAKAVLAAPRLRAFIIDYVESAFRGGNLVPPPPPPDQPFAHLTQAEKDKWPRLALVFELAPSLMRRPTDRRLGVETIGVVNGVLHELSVTWPARGADVVDMTADEDAVPDGGGNADTTANNADSTTGGAASGRVNTDGGGGNTGATGGGGGNTKGNGGPGPSTAAGGALAKMGFLKPGPVQFSTGPTSAWGITGVIQAFGDAALDDLRAAAHNASHMSIGTDEVVSFGQKILTVWGTFVKDGEPGRVGFVVDVVGPPPPAPPGQNAANDNDPPAKRMADAVWDVMVLKMRLTPEQIDAKLRAVHVDGAAVNTGAKSGFVKCLSDRLRRALHMVHCVAHRVSLVGATFLKDVSNTELKKMSPKQRRLNIVMRDLRAAVNAGAVASHVPGIAATQKSIMQLGDDGNEYRKVPTLALTRYFIMAPVMHILLTQWAPLLAAADRSGRGSNQFKEYGHNAGLLLVAAAVEPAFARMNQLCVYGQSSAHHVGSLRSMVRKTRDAIRELYGLGSDEQAGDETDAAAAADDDDDVAAVTAADNEDDAVAAADNDDDDDGDGGGGGGLWSLLLFGGALGQGARRACLAVFSWPRRRSARVRRKAMRGTFSFQKEQNCKNLSRSNTGGAQRWLDERVPRDGDAGDDDDGA